MRFLVVILFAAVGLYAGSALAKTVPDPAPTADPDHAGYLAEVSAGPTGTSWYRGNEDLAVGYGENACFTMHDADGEHAEIQALVIELGTESNRWTLEEGMLMTRAAFTHLCPEWHDLIRMIEARIADAILLRGPA
jgi:hypothetical protein